MPNSATESQSEPQIEPTIIIRSKVPSPYRTHRECALCGGWIDKEDFLNQVVNDGEVVSDAYACDECVAAGPDEIRQRMIPHVQSLRKRARAILRYARGLEYYAKGQGRIEIEVTDYKEGEFEDYWSSVPLGS
jgi:hypothetical protein